MEPDLARAQWRKSSRSSSNGQCVELAAVAGRLLVRDSKQDESPLLSLSPEGWKQLKDSL